ncbi:MAG TPA: hypothetical protein PLS63_05900 [Microthrixaceae bacterium]|nr:hypothetical protein [Microthrixaceae bacterium]
MAPPPSSTRQWVSFEYDDDTWMFDATFLMSSYRCIFNEGCKGVLDDDATDLGHGCCSFGAHFADKADRVRVRDLIDRLSADQWQLKEAAASIGGPIGRNDDGDWVTRTYDGACVMLNRLDFERGAGCALHVAALDHDERPMDWKPEVCWQVPIRLEFHTDEVGHTTHTLREWRRRDWGEGGQEFHWWCTESPEAYVAHEPLVTTCRDDIVGLVGQARYDLLRQHLGVDDGPASGVTWLPHPAMRRPSER